MVLIVVPEGFEDFAVQVCTMIVTWFGVQADLELSGAFYFVQWVFNKVDEWKHPTSKSRD
jgi:hypothetical protein